MPYGLGAIELHAADKSMRFEKYLHVVGGYSDAHYPSTHSGAPNQFSALAHDLAVYCKEFLRGDASKFLEAHREWEARDRDRPRLPG